MSTFRRLSVKVSETGEVTREIENADLDAFDTHDLLIKVAYSSLNYKDALSASGNKGISRFYPHTPGIDASGVVVRSKNPHFKEGDEVIVTGHDLGMNTRGGFSEYISVPAHWAVPLPENMSLKESMMLGTARYSVRSHRRSRKHSFTYSQKNGNRNRCLFQKTGIR
jgi:acrylyl-CoA reductase (NADPH)